MTHTYMKTTIEIADALLRAARKQAARERTTLRALVERGLHNVLNEKGEQKRFRLRRATFAGKGLQSGIDGDWETVRAQIYEGHGA